MRLIVLLSPLRVVMFKNIAIQLKPKLKIEKHYVSEKDVNEYIQGRRFTEFKFKDNKIIFSMFDGRKLVFIHTSKGWKICVKLGKLYMSKRELESYNTMVKQAIKNSKKEVPDECRSCFEIITTVI